MFEPDAEIDAQLPLDAAFQWVPKGRFTANGTEEAAYHLDDTLASLHPIFVIPWAAVKGTKAYFTGKVGF